MKVLCEACNTENRVQAMFCRGCAHKLPAFVATGPSALEGMKTWRPTHAPAPTDVPTPGMLPIETRGFWIRFVLLSVAITVGFVGWHAYVTRKVQAPAAAPSVNVAAAPPRSAPAAPAAVPDGPAEALVRIDRVPLQPVLPVQPVQRVQPVQPVQPARPMPPIEAPRAAIAEAPPPPLEPARPAAAPPRDDMPLERTDTARRPVVRAGSSDPRPGCAHLHFILASRCEATQCEKSAYERHPHCERVRDQRRRDEARRNLPF